jgi:ADP-ribosylglycohydrolase
MLGAIAGDIIGSRFEAHGAKKTKRFKLFTPANRFTDDTVLTVAVADTIINDGNYLKNYQLYYNMYPRRGYGRAFSFLSRTGLLRPYYSFGNGSAMRVSPVGWAFDNLQDTLDEAAYSAEATHSHPEGIKGAQAIAMAIFCARNGMTKKEIKKALEVILDYDLSLKLKDIPDYLETSCQKTIPICMAIFDACEDMEDGIRIAVQKGGDVDTNACIVASIAEAFYGQPPDIEVQEGMFKLLPDQMIEVVVDFIREYVYPDYDPPEVKKSSEIETEDLMGSLFE